MAILFSAVQIHDKIDDGLREYLVEVQLLEQVHEIGKEHNTARLNGLDPLHSLRIVRKLLNDGNTLN